MLNLRPVTQDDIKLLFKWANDPEVRLNYFNSKEIELNGLSIKNGLK